MKLLSYTKEHMQPHTLPLFKLYLYLLLFSNLELPIKRSHAIPAAIKLLPTFRFLESHTQLTHEICKSIYLLNKSSIKKTVVVLLTQPVTEYRKNVSLAFLICFIAWRDVSCCNTRMLQNATSKYCHITNSPTSEPINYWQPGSIITTLPARDRVH